MLPRRIHKTGQKTVIKAPTPDSYKLDKFISALLGELYMSMATLKHDIEALDQKSTKAVPFALQSLLSPFCRTILDFADSYKVTPGRPRKSATQSVENLDAKLMQFDTAYSELRQVVQITKVLHLIICDLIGAVAWFVKQYSILQYSFAVRVQYGQGCQIALTHRPKNWELRDVFHTLTSSHQAGRDKDKFIPFEKFIQALDNLNQQRGSNLKCSVRNYHNLKKRWKAGTFNNIV
jgi:hypothetical protein